MSKKAAGKTREKQVELEEIREIRIERPGRLRLSAEESLKRMKDFENRKDEFIASIRKSKDRNLPS